jgi:NhaP-type Na+/H+ or K+/H+ antiporter
MQSITESRDKKLFMGRFGPRGLASIVFNEHLSGGGTIIMKMVRTIALSIVGHGCSANLLVAAPVTQIKGSW